MDQVIDLEPSGFIEFISFSSSSLRCHSRLAILMVFADRLAMVAQQPANTQETSENDVTHIIKWAVVRLIVWQLPKIIPSGKRRVYITTTYD